MKGNYAVAVCDILGFSNLVIENSLDLVIEDTLGWFRRALYHSIHKDSFPSQIPTLLELETNPNLGIAWFSDTLLLYTLRDTDTCLQSLIQTVGWLLFETIIAGKTRIRCGISYGEAYLDQQNSIYVGRPIVDAYRLEEKQAWSGGALTEDAVKRVSESVRNGDYIDWWVKPYAVPLKNGECQTLAVDWTWGNHDSSFDLHWSRESIEPSERDWRERPDVCEKWKNTRFFHHEVCRWCK